MKVSRNRQDNKDAAIVVLGVASFLLLAVGLDLILAAFWPSTRAWDYESIARHIDSLYKRDVSESSMRAALKNYEGGTVSGSGKVLKFGECGWMTTSKRHGSDCLYIAVQNDSSRARMYLYFPITRRSVRSSTIWSENSNFTMVLPRESEAKISQFDSQNGESVISWTMIEGSDFGFSGCRIEKVTNYKVWVTTEASCYGRAMKLKRLWTKEFPLLPISQTASHKE